MKLANVSGRAVLVTESQQDGGIRGVDVHTLSEGRFGPDPADLYDAWDEFRSWAQSASLDEAPRVDAGPEELGPPSPRPRQIPAFGLNYSEHARESGFDAPDELPPTFTKFQSCLTGPHTTVTLPRDGHTDWEVELAVIIGREGFQIPEDRVWEHVAGLTVSQDLSERVVQLRGPAPQFGLGKSFPGFLPTGPYLVTPDELADRNDLPLHCELDGQTMQSSSTAAMIFPVAPLLSRLSHVIRLLPGDIVLTGTPDGVGQGRDPRVFIAAGQVLTSTIEGIGSLRQEFVS